MRRSARLAVHWEFRLSTVLFLISVYGAVYLVITKDFGSAGFALFCAYGFFQACSGFVGALDLRPRREQGAETLEG